MNLTLLVDISPAFDSESRYNVSIAKVSPPFAVRALDDFTEGELLILDTFGEGADEEDTDEEGVEEVLFIKCRTVSCTIFWFRVIVEACKELDLWLLSFECGIIGGCLVELKYVVCCLFVYDCKDEDLGLLPLIIFLLSGDTTLFFISAVLLLVFVLVGDSEGDLDEAEVTCALAFVLTASKEGCLDGLAEDMGEGDGEEKADNFEIDGFFFSLLFVFLSSMYAVLSFASFSFNKSCKSTSALSKALKFFSMYFQQSIQLDSSVMIDLNFGIILLM